MGRNDTRKVFKQFLVDEFGGACQSCGYDGSLQALEFHHVEEKDKAISKLIYRSSHLPTTINEVAKCVLLCANCHREVHAGLRPCPKKIRLNKAKMLSNYRCKCGKQITIWATTGKCTTCASSRVGRSS